MPYRALARFLFRAPLLPLRALRTGKPGLLDHPLGAMALDLASPDLVRARARPGRGSAGDRVAIALDRYHRRAAFRPTPHGLFAGVGVGELGPRTRADTGAPAPALHIAWGRLASLGLALLDLPEVRDRVCLRGAPSILRGAHAVVWLGPETIGGQIEEKRAELDEITAAVLDATTAWTAWPRVRAAAAQSAEADTGADDADAVDDLLCSMVADGLLHADLTPPLVGPDPEEWMRGRLEDLGVTAPTVMQLADARLALHRADLRSARRILAELPGGSQSAAPDLHATLLFPEAGVTLAAEAINRAAALAPLLFRLQEALAPPVAERAPRPALADALDATTDIFGAGALSLEALALGEYGVSPAGDDAAAPGGDGFPPETAAADPTVVAALTDLVLAAARQRRPDVALSSKDLAEWLPASATFAPPPTCELFITPARARPGRPPGHGWLLGLHAPAGATWGRFAHALGEPGRALLDPVREAETLARPGEQSLDVIFSPANALADVAAHPALRPAALALTGWPAEPQRAWTVAELALAADPSAAEPLALRAADGTPVAPSPLHRLRSATAPEGIWPLLVGFRLCRQHAPWALVTAALGDLAWTPRFALDGFVIAPATWRVPRDIAGGRASVRAVRAWRRRARVPRFVQVGHEDELLPIDLDAAAAARDLAGHDRVVEVWPPVGDTPDAAGRRLEAVVALADQPDPDRRTAIAASIAATAGAGAVPSPRRTRGHVGAEGWQTFKLFGPAAAAEALLVQLVHPAIAEARAAGLIDGWFFLRYVDGPGRRPHLRIRARARGGARPDDDLARALAARLEPAIASGDLVAIERTPYFPEAARFGGEAVLPTIHALFDADSELACALMRAADTAAIDDDDLHGVPDVDVRLFGAVAAFDALSRGLGLDPPRRRELARRRRAAQATAFAEDVGPDAAAELAEDLARGYRRDGPHLRHWLTGRAPPRFASPLAAFEAGIEQTVRAATCDVAKALPPLLHLSANRLLGIDRAAELRAVTCWERTLESLERHRP